MKHLIAIVLGSPQISKQGMKNKLFAYGKITIELNIKISNLLQLIVRQILFELSADYNVESCLIEIIFRSVNKCIQIKNADKILAKLSIN